MTDLKIRKIGGSYGVILPRDLLAKLRVNEGDKVYLTEGPDGAFLLSAYDPDFARKMDAAEDIMKRYRNALRALSR